MMDLHSDGRDVNIRLRDDVWALEERGTLSLTRTQAHALRLHLNAWENIELATLGEPKPRRASDHVALQVTRRELRPTKTHGSLIGWSLVLCAILTGAIILWVSL